MPNRTKKPSVKPEKRLEWLRRVERDGETLVQIADTDDFDIRTVRKQIETARLERDVQGARSEVLRETLVAHYRDLLETVQGIEKQITGDGALSIDTDQPLMLGLRQHMPRSPIWGNIKKWNQTVTGLAESLEVLPATIRESVIADGRLNGTVSQGAGGVTQAAVDILVHQMKTWARGSRGLSIQESIHSERTPEGKVRMKYGFSNFGELRDEATVEVIKTVLTDLESRVRMLPEYSELERLYSRQKRLGIAIKEVTTLVSLRRIVPGKCKYCPF